MAKNKFSVQSYPQMIGLRLDKALSLIPEIGTRSRAENLMEKKLVLVDQKIQKSSYKIKGQEIIEVEIPTENVQSELIPYQLSLDIVYEDNDVIVINKPSGLVVHPAAGHAQDTLVNALLNHTKNLSMKFNEQRPGIVHRIDKETSGLLVVAKNDQTHEQLSMQFKNKSTHRVYQAVVWGCPPDSGTISSWLQRHPIDRKKIASTRDRLKKIIRESQNKLSASDKEIVAHSKWAITHFKKIKSFGPFSLLQLNLETGRTHQIRVHLSELGYPIVGDSTYGADKKLNNLKNDLKKYQEVFLLNRFLLHAKELGFFHPHLKKDLFFECEWPDEEKKLLLKWGLLDTE